MYEMISSSHSLEGDGKQEKDNKKHSCLFQANKVGMEEALEWQLTRGGVQFLLLVNEDLE